MASNDRRRKSSGPTSLPPEVGGTDVSWDDDLPPALRGSKRPRSEDPPEESEFDRVTAIPELPPEVFAKSLKGAVRSAPPELPESAPPELNREPPTIPVQRLDIGPMSLDTVKPNPPRGAGSAPGKAIAPQSAPTARPNSLRQKKARAPTIPSPTGLELDLSVESVKTSRPRKRAPAAARDPRDPTIELDMPNSLARPAVDPALLEMKDRYAMGDFTGALVIAESISEAHPENLEAPRYAQNCRDVLIQMYSARLGSLTQRVQVAVPSDQIRWLTLDHRAGFLLSLVDGSSSIEEILDISGMTRLDALRIMYQLLDQRVIGLR